MHAQTTRLPWQFFIGPDGVVRTTTDSDAATTTMALARQGLARLSH